MKKEELLKKKREIVKEFPWEYRLAMTDDEIKCFSREQLVMLTDIISKAKEQEERVHAFYTLSANQVVHKETGTIIEVEEDGSVEKVSVEYIMAGAARNIYKNYIENKQHC